MVVHLPRPLEPALGERLPLLDAVPRHQGVGAEAEVSLQESECIACLRAGLACLT